MVPYSYNKQVTMAKNTWRKWFRIVHRDLSTGIDMRRRKDAGLESKHLNSYNKMYHGKFNSIAYDMFMGSHFFDRIGECCIGRYPGLTMEAFTQPCRAFFASVFQNHDTYMPETVHYFSEERDAFNKPLFQDTGQKPT